MYSGTVYVFKNYLFIGIRYVDITANTINKHGTGLGLYYEVATDFTALYFLLCTVLVERIHCYKVLFHTNSLFFQVLHVPYYSALT